MLHMLHLTIDGIGSFLRLHGDRRKEPPDRVKPRARSMVLAALVIMAAVAACEAGEVTLVQPETEADGGNVLEVRVVLEDRALGADFGWSTGVPEATAEWAYVQRRRYLFHDAKTDSAGMLRIDPEGSGMYWIAAAKAVELDGVPRVLAGGLQTRGSGDTLRLRLDEVGSLVISEIHMTSPPSWETAGLSYEGSKYIELYNNSLQSMDLDGRVVGVTYPIARDLSANGHHPCSYTKPFREDPDAVWSAIHWRFPGSGTDFPIAPGESVIIAVSAADHTQVHPSMLDLTDAEFEFLLSGAADNPGSPNLEKVWTDGGSLVNPFLISHARWFVSEPVDVEGLPTMLDDDWLYGDGTVYRGFPAMAIQDVSVTWWNTTSAAVLNRDAFPCDHPIHPTFDALPGGYLYGEANPEDLLVSPQRRVVRVEGGRLILLDTNTSKVDFENLPRTPGWIP